MSYTAQIIPQLVTTTPTEGDTYIWELNDAIREVKVVLANCILNQKSLARNDVYTATNDIHLIVLYGSAGSIGVTVNLPTASGKAGKEYIIKTTGVSGGIGLDSYLTIDPYLSETIDGDTTIVLNAKYSNFRHIVSDGTNWLLIGRNE